jgi:hypothetical protein
VAKYGFKHDPGLLPADKSDQELFKYELPGARVVKCTWGDGPARAGEEDTDLFGADRHP